VQSKIRIDESADFGEAFEDCSPYWTSVQGLNNAEAKIRFIGEESTSVSKMLLLRDLVEPLQFCLDMSRGPLEKVKPLAMVRKTSQAFRIEDTVILHVVTIDIMMFDQNRLTADFRISKVIL